MPVVLERSSRDSKKENLLLSGLSEAEIHERAQSDETAEMRKERKCRDCGAQYMPIKPMQPRCISCAIIKGRQKTALDRHKEEEANIKARIQALKTPRELASKAQAQINKYVRLRDRALPCVSCSRGADWAGQWHASHWKSTAANSANRFNLHNIHKSCSICNNWLSGNVSEYRIEERIGKENMEKILSTNPSRRYSVEYLIRLDSVFRKKILRLEKRIKSEET